MEITVCIAENVRETEEKNLCSRDGGFFQEYNWQGCFLSLMGYAVDNWPIKADSEFK